MSTCRNSRTACWWEMTSMATKTHMDSNCWKRSETCQHWSAHRVAAIARSCWLEELRNDSNAPLGACRMLLMMMIQIRIQISPYPKAYISQKFPEHSPTTFWVILFNVENVCLCRKSEKSTLDSDPIHTVSKSNWLVSCLKAYPQKNSELTAGSRRLSGSEFQRERSHGRI